VSKRNLIVWTAIVAVLAASVLLVPRADRPGYLVFVGSAVLVIATSSWLMYQPRFVAYVEGHPRRLRLTGWIIVVAGVALAVGYPALTLANLLPLAGFEVVLYGTAVLGLVGFFIASFPRLSAHAKRSREKLDALESAPPQASTFSPLAEGVRASLSVLRSPAMFLRISGSWVLLLVIGLFALERLNFTKDPALVVIALFVLLGLILVLLLLIPTTGVAWARWVGQHRAPNRIVALPDRAVLSVTWQLWLFNFVVGGAGDRLSAWLANELKSAGVQQALAVADAAGTALSVMAVWLAAPFAVRLAARALDDKDFRFVDLGPLRKQRLTLGVGLVTALAPGAVLAWLADSLSDALRHPGETRSEPGPVSVALMAVALMLLLTAVASGAAYLTRAYAATKSPP
jgi:hypothetical protein